MIDTFVRGPGSATDRVGEAEEYSREAGKYRYSLSRKYEKRCLCDILFPIQSTCTEKPSRATPRALPTRNEDRASKMTASSWKKPRRALSLLLNLKTSSRPSSPTLPATLSCPRRHRRSPARRCPSRASPRPTRSYHRPSLGRRSTAGKKGPRLSWNLLVETQRKLPVCELVW
jgi:hypothetical protein